MNPAKKIMLLLIFMLFIFTSVNSQDKRIDSLETRIKYLEDYKNNIDQLYMINSEKLSKNINDKFDEKIKDIDDAKRILNLLLFIGIPGTVIGLLAVYVGAINKAKKIITNKIVNIVEQKREDLIKLIETQEFDSKLRKSKRLIVLSPNPESNDQIKNIFKKFKFQEVIFRVINQYTQMDNFDLIIFNDYDGSLSQEIINEYIEKISDDEVSFVAYTTKNLHRNPRINFSNSPFTLYHSILSTLKYSELQKITGI